MSSAPHPPEALASGMRALGHRVVSSSTATTIVFSPAILSTALGMLREGLTGVAAEEVERVAALPPDRRTSFRSFLTALHRVGDAVVEHHAGMFADPALTLDPEYPNVLSEWYGAVLERVAFPDPALRHINAWVSERTHGRIPRLFDRLHPADVLALVTTVYLDARWRSPFAAADTSDGPFTRADGTSVRVPLMRRRLRAEYAEGPGWQAVRLPYRGGDLEMWVLLPAAEGGREPADLLSPELLAQIPARTSPREVALTLPRWQGQSTLPLASTLRALGMAAVFDGPSGSTAATPASDLRLSHVVQQATIDVGESGTVAAAATGLSMRPTAVSFAVDEVRFRADHPFSYVVVHTPTGAPLFEGVLGDPL